MATNSEQRVWKLRNTMREAVTTGDLGSISNLLDEQPLAVSPMSLVILAISHNDPAITRLIIEKTNCDINQKQDQGLTPMSLACTQGNKEIVSLLLEKGATPPYDLPFMQACIKGHADVVRLLLERTHIDVTGVINESKHTLLHLACVQGWPAEVVKALIREGHAQVDVCSTNGQTPLHVACSRGHTALAQVLLEEGHADVSKEDFLGNTPLLFACENEYTDIVHLLIQHDVDVNQPSHGETALYKACKSRHTSVIRALLSSSQLDANVCATDGNTALISAICSQTDTETITNLITQGHADVNKSDSRSQSPLHIACMLNDFKTVELLVTYKANIDSQNVTGITPLMQAVESCSCDNMKNVYTLLMAQADANKEDLEGRTAFHIACSRGCLVALQALVEHCDLDKPDKKGKTPLHYACEASFYNGVFFLLETGKVDANKPDCAGFTPLHVSATCGNLPIVRLLLDKGKASVNKPDCSGVSSLFCACKNGHADVVHFLLEKGHADIGKGFPSGTTYLHEVAKLGYINIARMLLEKGADANQTNSEGLTALFSACHQGHTDVVRLLIEQGKADARKCNNFGCTPLGIALKCGHREVVNILERFYGTCEYSHCSR